jgi:hypothetical protein
MVTENPSWGAPRIHGEFLMLGFEVSETTISRWMRRAPRNPEPANRWGAFLRNHREAIVAMDFFTVPTLTFNLLYCFFLISHDRRCILHSNVTQHPTSSWIVQQLREAFPYQSTPKFLILDHDAKYGLEVPAAIRSMNMGCVANLHPEPLAKWNRRALGQQLPTRAARSDHPLERASSQAAPPGVHLLLP